MAEEKKNPFHTPLPHDTPVMSPPPGKRAPTPAERVRESYIQAEELKATVDVLGKKRNTDADKSDGGLDPNKMAEILAANTNAYMKSYADGLTTLMTTMVASQAAAAAGGKQGDSQFLQYLIGEMKGMKEKMEGGGGDPLEQIDQYHKKMIAWQEEMRTQFGIGPLGAAGNAPNIEVMKLMIEVEDRKNERAQLQVGFQVSEAEKQRQYLSERDDLHRRWKIEDDKWNAELNIKMAQFNLDGNVRKESVDTFKDVAGSFIASLQVKPEAASPGIAAPQAPRQEVNFPVSMTCTELDPTTKEPCGTQFAWPPGQMSTKCPKCGADYNLKKAE